MVGGEGLREGGGGAGLRVGEAITKSLSGTVVVDVPSGLDPRALILIRSGK